MAELRSHSPAPAPTALLPALTGVRFVLALWVVAYHVLRPWLSAPDTAGWLAERGKHLLAGAPVAVTVFFVLSGFVLTRMYQRDEALDVRAFAAARVARLAPIYVLAVVVVVPIGVFVRARGIVDDGFLSLLFVATATQAWVPDAALQWNPPLWSVSVEAAFCLAFPFLLPRIARASLASVGIMAAVAWALSVAGGVLYEAFDPDGIGPIRVDSRGFWLHVLRFNPLVRLPDLFIGMAAARFFADMQARGTQVSSLAGLGAATTTGAVLASGLLPVPLLHGSLLAPLAAVLVLSLATSRGVVARFLSTSALQRLGEASYALYALHIPVWLWMAAFAGRKLEDTGASFALAVAVVSVAVAVAAHMTVEKPLRARIRAWATQGTLSSTNARAPRSR